jgi:histidyl-tRNA synthetase
MSRVAPVSGFPEWAPEERVIERHVIETLREVFALHGFAEIETRAIEPLDRLRGDSEAAKEIYALRRVLADAEDGDSGMGLHFDLTVPFARYVEEFSGKLAFPFRRYQIQKVWRGERPQEGRFREFCQADIDVVARDNLPAQFEVEVAVVVARALGRLPIPPVRIHVNDRRLVEAFYRGVGVADVPAALRSVDKLDKIGRDGVAAELRAAGVSEAAIAACLDLAGIAAPDDSFADQVRALGARSGVASAALEEGIASLVALVDGINAAVPGVARADLRIARGLDYYTGAVYETFLVGHEDLGSICSGGRYDNLVMIGGSTLPGVGISVGVTRLVSRILSAELAVATRGVPSAVLVAVADDAGRPASEAVASALRERGIPCEVAPSAAKFGKQIQHADRRGIPFVWFPGQAGDEVKDIRSGDQVPADSATWGPPPDDLWPRVERR